MSDLSTHRSLIERLARHLATHSQSDWPSCVEDAASLLAILKEPDAVMVKAGDATIWQAMIDAALTERWSIEAALGQASSDGDAGSDEEGEIALPANHGDRDNAAWVHTRDKKGE